MRSVADELRGRTIAHVLGLTPAARIALALSLGDVDLDLFVRTSGLDRDEARRRLSAQRQTGRAPSIAATRRRP
jgi:hypothetical protein